MRGTKWRPKSNLYFIKGSPAIVGLFFVYLADIPRHRNFPKPLKRLFSEKRKRLPRFLSVCERNIDLFANLFKKQNCIKANS